MAKRRNETDVTKDDKDAQKVSETSEGTTAETTSLHADTESGSTSEDSPKDDTVQGDADNDGMGQSSNQKTPGKGYGSDDAQDDASPDADDADGRESKGKEDGRADNAKKKPKFVLVEGGKKDDKNKKGKQDKGGKDGKSHRIKHPRILAVLLAGLIIGGGVGGYLYYQHVTQPAEQQVAPGDWEHMVAGTVDGHDIMESEVNAYVARYRKMANMTGDAEWATYLDKQGLTIKSFREKAVKALQEQYVAEQEAKDADLSVTDSDIDAAISDARKQAGYEDDDDGWKSFLDGVGYTEETYRADIRATYIENALAQKNAVMSTPTETQMQSEASEDVSKWTGKKVYAVTVKSGDSTSELARARAKAQAIADAVNKGGNPVTADALTQASAPEGGTVSEIGWSGLVTMQDAYKTAIESLHAGQVSSPVRSDEGYAVVLVSDEFDADASDTIRVSDMPRDLYDKLYEQTSQSLNANAVSTYLDGLLAKHESSVSDMPDGLPYYVDIDAKSQFGTNTNTNANASEDGTAADGNTTTSADGTQAGE